MLKLYRWKITLLVLAVISYGFYEAHSYKITQVTIKNNALSTAMGNNKALLISDTHFGQHFSTYQNRLLKKIKQLKPDIIFLTGDYVDWNQGKEVYQNALRFISQLPAPLGVFAVLGDADHSSSRHSCLFCHQNNNTPKEQSHITFLRNNSVKLFTGRRRVMITGIAPHTAWPQLPQDTPSIVLSHTSSVFNLIDAKQNILVLAGDTHGGQIRLPSFLWRLIRYKPDPSHIYGLFREGNKSLYVTSGLGWNHLPIRIGMPPEMVLLTFSK